MLRQWWSGSVFAYALLAACAHGRASSVATATPEPPAWTALCDRSIELTRGTPIDVRLNEPIQAQSDSVGQQFTATVANPLRAGSGCIIAPRGALVRGTVVAVDLGAAPSVRLAFDRMDTAFGVARIRATVRHPESVGMATVEQPLQSELGSADAIVRSRALGGGPGGPGTGATLLPVNTELHLVIMHTIWIGESSHRME